MAAATVEKLLRGKLHHDLMSLNFIPAPKKSVIFFQTPLLFLLRVVEADEYRKKKRALFGYFGMQRLLGYHMIHHQILHHKNNHILSSPHLTNEIFRTKSSISFAAQVQVRYSLNWNNSDAICN